MKRHSRKLIASLVLLLVFAAGVAFFSALNRGPAASGSAAASDGSAPRTTDELIVARQKFVRQRPYDADGFVLLADAYLQKFRERGDAALYTRAGRALARARQLEPGNSAVYTGLGTLALGRHDFRGGLRDGKRAVALAPDLVRPLGVVVDAQIELGRYRAAARTLQRMVDLKPNLASYSRVSYFRELNGDLGGATEAMKLAVAAGGDTPESVAYVQSLLGHLHFTRGRLGAASLAYRTALYRYPGYGAAEAGLARVEAARGNLDGARARLRSVVQIRPSADLLIEMGAMEQAAGRQGQARRDFAAARTEQQKLVDNGENVATEAALLEADHGPPARALKLAREAWANAPSIRSADAMGWALTASGRPRAGLRWARRSLRLGSRDPLLLYHAGIAARDAGRTGEARQWLTAALALNPGFSPLHAPRAERALARLR